MDKRANLDEEQVRVKLRKAFRNIPSDFASKNLSHDFYREMRKHLHLLLPIDIQCILPRILEDLLNTHTNNSIITEGAEFVAQHLNVLSYYPDKVYSEMAQLLGKKAAQNAQADAAATREGKIEQFKDFTPEQAKAILEWLLLARSWSDFDGYKDDIEAAIEYWRQRALQRDSRSHKRDN